jgi:tetratricopeptide (TPR) repeat protein
MRATVPWAGSILPALLLAASCLTNFVPSAGAHGDLHARILALTLQIQTNTTTAELLLQRADLSRQHSDFPAALTDTAAALRLQPNWPAAWLQQARIQFDAGQAAAAITSATACLKQVATNSDALVIRARSHAQLGQLAEAVADFNAVLTTTNGSRPLPDLYLERARAQAALGQLADAVRGLDEGQAQLGNTPSLTLPALDYERTLGNFPAALARLERGRNFFTTENYLALRGDILQQAGRHSEAQTEFRAGLAHIENLPPGQRARPQTQALTVHLQASLMSATPDHTPHAK